MKPKLCNLRGCKLGEGHPNLTETQSEIINFITNEFLTVKQISIRREITTQAVYKILKKLYQKGILSHTKGGGCKKATHPCNLATPHHTGTTTPKKIRLHAQEWNIKLLFCGTDYKEKVGKLINIDGNSVKCNRNSLEVYSGQSFYADSAEKATSKSIQYWNIFFQKLENHLKIIILKSRYENIKLVNNHYSEINNELSIDCHLKAEKIRIYTREDGKLWFTIDNSFNLHEAETLHPTTAEKDMQETIAPFFNDLRGELTTMSELRTHLKQIQENISLLVETEKNIILLLSPPKMEDKGIVEQERAYYVG